MHIKHRKLPEYLLTVANSYILKYFYIHINEKGFSRNFVAQHRPSILHLYGYKAFYLKLYEHKISSMINALLCL